MKKHLIILIVGFMTTVSLLTASEPAPQNSPQPIRKEENNIRSNRPLSPGNVRIYFSYFSQTGECRFILRPEIEYMTVYLEHTQTHIIYSGEVYADDPVMYQPLDCGVYHITCITDDGSTYAGEVVI